MGLDMYVYRIKKLTDEEIKEMTGMIKDDAEDQYDILAIPQEVKDSGEYAQILSILRPVRMKQNYYDYSKIRKDCGFLENWELYAFGFSPEAVLFTVHHLERYVIPFEEIREELPEDKHGAKRKIFEIWKSRPENREKKARPEDIRKMDAGYEIAVIESEKNVSISTEDIREKYTITKEEDFLCCSIESGAYWRKDYPLQDRIYEVSPYTIENCGYYPLTDEMAEVINDNLRKEGAPALEAGDGEVLVYHEWY